MSISGYAELIENGMVQMGDIPEFAGRIHQEANRLTALVQDIIQLSKLEEGHGEFPVEEVDICELTEDIRKTLEHAAQKKDIKVTVDGEGIMLDGVRQILYEMFYNLMDNGIKYNVEHGWMKVHIGREQGKIFWQVEDGGIGIAQEDQYRDGRMIRAVVIGRKDYQIFSGIQSFQVGEQLIPFIKSAVSSAVNAQSHKPVLF